MKKHLFKLLTTLFLLVFLANVYVVSAEDTKATTFLEKSIAVTIGSPVCYMFGQTTYIDTNNHEVVPVLQDSRTLMPVRFMIEGFGGQVAWDEETQTATLSLNGDVVEITIGSSELFLNSQAIALDVPAQKINDRTFIPLRAVNEALRKNVYFYNGFILVSSEEVFDPITPPIYYEISNKQIKVSGKYSSTDDLCVTVRECGGNNIIDFAEFALIKNPDSFVLGNLETTNVIYSSYTDWHSPFKIAALENVDGDQPKSLHFTGGNHAYENSAKGTPTANTKYLQFYVDGKEITDGFGYANNIEIRWCNAVQGYNTKKLDGSGRPIMDEIHSLSYDGISWSSNVELKATEKMLVTLAYGFQAPFSSNNWGDKVKFEESANIVFISLADIYAMNAHTFTSENSTAGKIICQGTQHSLSIELDTSYGLGDGSLYKGNKRAFAIIYNQEGTAGKAYFDLLSGNNVLEQGNSLKYRGYYRFYPTA